MINARRYTQQEVFDEVITPVPAILLDPSSAVKRSYGFDISDIWGERGIYMHMKGIEYTCASQNSTWGNLGSKRSEEAERKWRER